MANERQKLIHIHSREKNKIPVNNSLEYGEIAVNFAHDSEKLYIKNDFGAIVGFVNEKEFEESEKVTSAAILELDTNVNILKNNNVGKKTPEGGEIFNDYKNNKASAISHAEGQQTKALANGSHAEGQYTVVDATGTASHSEGFRTHAIGLASHSEGDQTTAWGNRTHSEGTLTIAMGDSAHAEGRQTVSSGPSSHSEGSSTKVSPFIVGNENNTTVYNSWINEKFSLAKGNSSHAEGFDCLALGDYSHVEGKNTSALKPSAHAEGETSYAMGDSSHAEGYFTNAKKNYSHAEGQQTTANGSASHAEGYKTVATGSYAHTEGYFTKTTNMAEHASGIYNVSSQTTQFSIGQGTSDTDRKNIFEVKKDGTTYINNIGGFTGNNYNSSKSLQTVLAEFVNEKEFEESEKVTSAAIVKLNIEKTNKADSVGQKMSEGEIFNDYENNKAIGIKSHAEGSGTTASGDNSHAEGTGTTASGHYGSHAEGTGTTASGHYGSHAEGTGTTASGDNSHAEGTGTTASGHYGSHAEGSNTIASGYASHAEGKYNVDIPDAIHIVGIGNFENERLNAHTITTDGKHYIPGIGGYDGTQTDLSTVKDVATAINENGFISITYSDLKEKREKRQLIPGTNYRITDYVTTTVQEGTKNGLLTENQKLKDLDLTKFPFDVNYQIRIDDTGTTSDPNYGVYDTFLGIGVEVSRYTGRKSFTLYKTDTSSSDWETNPRFNHLDTEAKYYYVGTEKVAEVIYDKWQKSSDNGNYPYDGEEYYLTPRIVKNNVPEQYDEGIIYDYIKEGEISGFVELPGTHKDIIVTALSKDKLSEEAKVVVEPQSPGSYYYSSKPEAWKIWYCLDNDKSRFDWADEVNGKGVIYRMIDEFGNDCPYDFKSIQFKRDVAWFNKHQDWCNSVLGEVPTEDRWYFTFSWVDEMGNVMDASIVGNDGTLLDDTGEIWGVYDNKMLARGIDGQELNNNLFVNTHILNEGFFYGCNSNTFEYNCGFNTFGNNCCHNIFGNGCNNNAFGYGCEKNTFGYGCYNNSLGDEFYDNSFKKGCYNNTFSYDCYSNSFGNGCHSNSFGNNCSSNSFGNDCYSNSFGNDCYSNSFGNDCYSNSFGTTGDKNGVKQDFILNCVIENGVRNVHIWNATQGTAIKSMINLTLCQGLNNTNTNLPIQLRDELYNSNFQVKIAKKSNGKVVQYCEADLIADQN